ncbi:MAG: isopentenyl-diphosphate Delta-isomerase [Candidatus Saccharimonadaceae bacterium]
MMEEKVVLIDENDIEVGTMPKMEAHQKALLHRAISVFIFNEKGEWLLQRRALSKYHSSGLWSNAACTHPRPNESYLKAAERRLLEEMGLQCELTDLFNFIYKEKLDNELTEHELDHVFIGYSEEVPNFNAEEVCDFKYIDFDELANDIREQADKYTYWFKHVYENVQKHLK